MTASALATTSTSPLAVMVRETPTDYWNDSCGVADLEYAVARGATGATSNPTIVLEVLRREQAHWLPRIREIARTILGVRKPTSWAEPPQDQRGEDSTFWRSAASCGSITFS